MAKIEKIGLFIGIVTGVPAILGYIAWAMGWFDSLPINTLLLFIIILLVVVLSLSFYLLWGINRIINPHKPPLVKSHTEPDTYIFLHGQWRKIPDWQTRDYLAHLLGFRPGEEDISLKTKDEIDKLMKGANLESIKTYAGK
jgi:hypothetical protein